MNNWHDLHLMVGLTATILVRLLFVSLSLKAEAITLPANSDLQVLVEQTFSSFLCILSFAILFLIPPQAQIGLGAPLLAVGGFGLFGTPRHFLRIRPSQPHLWGKGTVARHFSIPLMGFIFLITISVSVLIGTTDGLYWLIPVTISWIPVARLYAWDLLL